MWFAFIITQQVANGKVPTVLQQNALTKDLF